MNSLGSRTTSPAASVNMDFVSTNSIPASGHLAGTPASQVAYRPSITKDVSLPSSITSPQSPLAQPANITSPYVPYAGERSVSKVVSTLVIKHVSGDFKMPDGTQIRVSCPKVSGNFFDTGTSGNHLFEIKVTTPDASTHVYQFDMTQAWQEVNYAPIVSIDGQKMSKTATTKQLKPLQQALGFLDMKMNGSTSVQAQAQARSGSAQSTQQYLEGLGKASSSGSPHNAVPSLSPTQLKALVKTSLPASFTIPGPNGVQLTVKNMSAKPYPNQPGTTEVKFSMEIPNQDNQGTLLSFNLTQYYDAKTGNPKAVPGIGSSIITTEYSDQLTKLSNSFIPSPSGSGYLDMSKVIGEATASIGASLPVAMSPTVIQTALNGGPDDTAAVANAGTAN